MANKVDFPIHLTSLTRRYGDVLALDGIDLEVGRGELFGLIGPDGAGKTSMMRILTTMILPTSGSATVDGFDVVKQYRDVRKIIGYMPGRFSLYTDLTVEENLQFFATVFGTTIGENYDLVKDIYSHIEPFKHRLAGQLSGGMKQKLALSCALIHRPRVLFLDEPTTGVDVVSRKELWAMLRGIKEQGITILVSTPYMDEAMLCDRVALIQQGRFLNIDTPGGITRSFPGQLLEVRASDMYQLMKDLRTMPEVESAHLFGQYAHVTLHENCGIQGLNEILVSRNHNNIEINGIDPTIEDCFIREMRTDNAEMHRETRRLAEKK